jgi:hypothetical protein
MSKQTNKLTMICGRKSVTSDLYCDIVRGNVGGDVQDDGRNALAAVRHMTWMKASERDRRVVERGGEKLPGNNCMWCRRRRRWMGSIQPSHSFKCSVV